jgi:L-lactate dehydrogenase complex protein LldE
VLKAQLFITCLAEQFYPNVLKKMVELLERLDVQVEFPAEQTCCGQPLFNSGFQSQARSLARNWIETFSRSDAVVVSPSGSCVDMVRHTTGTVPHGRVNTSWLPTGRANFRVSDYLVNQPACGRCRTCYPCRVTYHTSCHQLRFGIAPGGKAIERSERSRFVPPRKRRPAVALAVCLA